MGIFARSTWNDIFSKGEKARYNMTETHDAASQDTVTHDAETHDVAPQHTDDRSEREPTIAVEVRPTRAELSARLRAKTTSMRNARRRRVGPRATPDKGKVKKMGLDSFLSEMGIDDPAMADRLQNKIADGSIKTLADIIAVLGPLLTPERLKQMQQMTGTVSND